MVTLHRGAFEQLLLAVIVVGVFAALSVHGQPMFEVASVKRNSSWFSRGFQIGQPPGRFTATNVPLRQPVIFAYQLQPFQLEGGPSWIDSERFDITAKLPGSPPPPSSMLGARTPGQLALRSLLAERFKLVLRHQPRELPVYALVVARTDRKLGPHLRQSTTDCTKPTSATASGPLCGVRGFQGGLRSNGLPLGHLAANLAPLLHRMVVDRTELTGNFDFELSWTPDQLPPGGRGEPPPGEPAIDPNGPSLFAALQEQLGLKLESTKGPVDILVIDRVERLTAD